MQTNKVLEQPSLRAEITEILMVEESRHEVVNRLEKLISEKTTEARSEVCQEILRQIPKAPNHRAMIAKDGEIFAWEEGVGMVKDIIIEIRDAAKGEEPTITG